MGQNLGLQGVAIFEVGEDQHADVDFAADQQVLDVGAFVLHHPYLDIGISTLKPGDQIREVITSDKAGHTDDQLPGNLIGALLQAAFGVIHRRQNQVRLP